MSDKVKHFIIYLSLSAQFVSTQIQHDLRYYQEANVWTHLRYITSSFICSLSAARQACSIFICSLKPCYRIISSFIRYCFAFTITQNADCFCSADGATLKEFVAHGL